ncbi:hypothetical protein B5F77_14845 [Parabacteroides sp. An277]|uniref:leucine-rich repeat domain-containing protein n=1 Tax=Parabacteroides sp. An277 TaxID=1965619 RepID=UPI000B3A033B|nr:leucine-rich repeat domain-containing protein [Parabacteroides sp. An277]OUO49411.1 hypothetical protein B5F77_14845 [Parabacteroides sp. An277]
MKVKSLLAAMMAAALSFNFVACSDDDDPVPGGGNGADGKTIIINVEEPGTFQSEYDNIISHYDESSELNNLVVKGKLNREDMHNLEFARSIQGYYEKWADTIYLDMSEIQIVESTYNGESYKANHLYGGMGWTGYVISKFPKNIEVIEDNIDFGKVLDISNLLSEKLEEIGNGAFAGKDFTPTEIVFPKSLKRIGESAFKGSNIKKIKTQGNLNIESEAFSNCSLEEVELNGVEIIGKNVFSYCVPENEKMVISMPDVKYIREEAFNQSYNNNKRNNSELEIKDIKNLIDIENDAFAGIERVEIDLSEAENLNTIGDRAFKDVVEDEIVIPENVKRIGSSAFKSLGVVRMRPQTPPLCGNPFTTMDNQSRYIGFYCDTLYVPKGCKSIYEKDAWHSSSIYDYNLWLSFGIQCNVILEE